MCLWHFVLFFFLVCFSNLVRKKKKNIVGHVWQQAKFVRMNTAVGKYLGEIVHQAQDVVWSTNIIQSAIGILGVVLQHLIKRPCLVIYNNAPAVIGGWEGREPADICAQMTGTKATFWQGDNMHECLSMIERRFESWFTTVIVLLYAFTLYQIVRLIWYLCVRKITGGWNAKENNPQVQLVYYPIPETQWEDNHPGHKPLQMKC